MTLKSGIERMLMHWVPEVHGVVAVDDTGFGFDVVIFLTISLSELEKISNDQLKQLEDKLASQHQDHTEQSSGQSESPQPQSEAQTAASEVPPQQSAQPQQVSPQNV